MFDILSTLPPSCRSAAMGGATTWYDIIQCSQDMRELPLGSEEFLARLRKGCDDDDKGVQLDDEVGSGAMFWRSSSICLAGRQREDPPCRSKPSHSSTSLEQ